MSKITLPKTPHELLAMPVGDVVCAMIQSGKIDAGVKNFRLIIPDEVGNVMAGVLFVLGDNADSFLEGVCVVLDSMAAES